MAAQNPGRELLLEQGSLQALLKSPDLKSLTFRELINIQISLPNKNKTLTIAFADELLSRKEMMAVDSLKAKAYVEIGNNYRNYGDNRKAKYYLEESVAIFGKVKDSVQLADAMNRLAVYYANTDEDSLAIAYYTQSMTIGESIRDTLLMIRPLKGLTGLYVKMGLYQKVSSYGEMGLNLAKKINHTKTIAALSNNLAASYADRKQYAKAINYYREALKMNTKLSETESVIRNLSNIGTIYSYTNNLDSAEKYCALAVNLLPKIEVPRTSIYTYAALAEVKNKQQKYREAIQYAKMAITLSRKTQLESLTDGAFQELANAYKGLKMPDSALVALESCWEIKQKFLETNRNKSVAKVEQAFQQYKKEKEIEMQNAEIDLLKKDKKLSSFQRNAATIGAVLLGLLAFLFYTRYRLKKKTSDELTQKNVEIERQKVLIQASLGEKETLLREIHHRVKNNLQIISSLLDLQSANIQDEAVLSSIQEGQSRVQAMSLIHQNLYQSDHLSNVDIEKYLQQLVDYLSSMFTGGNESIAISVEAPQINFDIDTAIPLGLIVNELVSNAYKYAFKKNGSGHISVRIKSLSETDYELNVTDDGKGLPTGFDETEVKSLGLKLVKILTRQLRGTFSVMSDNGATFVVKFKDLRRI